MIGQHDGFVCYLAEHWDKPFENEHSYPIPNSAAWISWQNNSGYRHDSLWYCKTLKQASEHYSWKRYKKADSILEFKRLSGQLISQIAESRRDNEKVEDTCLEIFDWGGVAKGKGNQSKKWIKKHVEDRTLCEQLRAAVDVLQAPQPDFACFKSTGFLMNSAMTKVYAASVPDKLIIYDGRVGAALGKLAASYLSARHDTHLPKELTFAWGKARPRKHGPGPLRNPSGNVYIFPPLFGAGDAIHAQMMHGASKMLVKVAEKIAKSDDGNKTDILGQLERALFMIGYDVGQLK